MQIWSAGHLESNREYCTSVIESEILSILTAVNEVEYIVSLINELKINSSEIQPITIFNDNISAKHSLETGGEFHRNKHYRNRINRIVRAIDELIRVNYKPTTEMPADQLTKSIPNATFKKHLIKIGLIQSNLYRFDISHVDGTFFRRINNIRNLQEFFDQK